MYLLIILLGPIISIALILMLIYVLFNLRPKMAKTLYYAIFISILGLFMLSLAFNFRLFIRDSLVASQRLLAMRDLKKLYIAKHNFIEQNHKMPNSIREMGISSNDIQSYYNYYLNNDVLGKNAVDRSRWPANLKRDKNIIYAIAWGSQLGDWDILLIDANGKICVIREFDVWPLPEP